MEIGQEHLQAQRNGQSKNFCSPTNDWSFPAPSVIKPEEREFVVDSGPSMHMLSKKDLNSAELETVRVCKKVRWQFLQPTVKCKQRRSDSVCQRIGFIRDNKASGRYTRRSLTRKILRRPRVFLPLNQWYVPIVVPGLSTKSSSSATLISLTSAPQEAVTPSSHPASTRCESTSDRVR